jgi:membrane protein YqaA with SNARE-associated domain
VEWLNVTAESGLWGLLAASFLSATVLPGGSEALLGLFAPASGGSWAGADAGHPRQHRGWHDVVVVWPLPAALAAAGKPAAQGQLERWGSPALLLAWAPLIGDALCLAAGWLRLHWLPCCLFMAIGKFARYWLVAQSALP